MLERQGKALGITDWSRELLGEMRPIAAAMDAAVTGGGYRDALQAMERLLDDPARLPSARVLDRIARDPGGSYIHVISEQSDWARQSVLALDWSEQTHARYLRLAAASIADQRRIEAEDVLSFEEFRQDYVSPARLQV